MQNINTKKSKTLKEREVERRERALVDEVTLDFENRRKQRKLIERQWELNMNFLAGNQYCGLNSRGEIENEYKSFFWQNRGVFNHIAPIFDSRTAKFSRITSDVSVRPRTDDDKDVEGANLAEKLIAEAFKKNNFDSVIKKVIAWSETCGTGFYKVLWNDLGGSVIGEVDGEQVFEGEACVTPVSPFEIFPDNLYAEEVEDCASIIHARALSVNEVKEKYGVALSGEKVSVYSLNSTDCSNNKYDDCIDNAVVVIERYEKPSENYPEGRLITVAGDKLIFEGAMPYFDGDKKSRCFPFVKQVSLALAGNFFGISVIDRLIPIQRAFNAVKNRKHEFLNRLSMGVMTVEDGSVDVDDLQDEGLSPGKVLVYRQGSKAPEIMVDASMPDDFNEEEAKLINEFVIISGVSDVTSSASNAALSSGTALKILIEQDNERLMMSAEEIRRSILGVAKRIIWLYAQFTEGVRAVTYRDGLNKTRKTFVDGKALNSDDVYLDSENELLYTNSQKKEMIFKLHQSGLLTDEEGKLRPSTKEKVLALLGYKDLDYQKGLARLHEEKAIRENEQMRNGEIKVDEIDDNALHIDEHVRYVLSEYRSLNDEQKRRFYAHVLEHKEKLKIIMGE